MGIFEMGHKGHSRTSLTLSLIFQRQGKDGGENEIRGVSTPFNTLSFHVVICSSSSYYYYSFFLWGSSLLLPLPPSIHISTCMDTIIGSSAQHVPTKNFERIFLRRIKKIKKHSFCV